MRYDENPDRNCANGDTEAWFPDPSDQRATYDAIKLCDSCPVRQECLDDTMRIEAGLGKISRVGIFGGLTPAQRFNLERKGGDTSIRPPGRPRRPIRHGTFNGYKTHRKRGEEACDECRAAQRVYSKQIRERGAA